MDQNSKPRTPIYPLPLSPFDFQQAQETAYQQTVLQPDVIREDLRHRRAMEREQQKSHLRQNEVLQRQQARLRHYQITCSDNSVRLQVISGTNIVLAEKTLFRCRVTQLKCYQFDNNSVCFWQIILMEQDGGSEVESELYDPDLLTSPRKLHNTILSKYVCANDKESSFYAWGWMSSLLNALYEDAPIIRLPYRAGWFEKDNQWRLWTDSEDCFLLSDQAEKFSVNRFENQNAEETISSFLDAAAGISDSFYISSVLWIFRLAALLGRLTTAVPLGIGLTIVGNSSRIVAEKFLRTMNNDVDTASLDSCRLTDIKNQAKLLQDTPLIFVSSNPNCRSTQNRIEEVHSWIDTGYIGGEKVALSFVFCLQKFAKQYPLDGTVIIDANKIKNSNASRHFSRFQGLIISTIENAGTYWINELRNEYVRQMESENTAMALYRTVNNTVLSMFERGLKATTKSRYTEFIRLGEEEMNRQLSLQYGILLDTFRNNVWQLVDENTLIVAGRDKYSANSSNICIYYDDMFYYFTRKVFDYICQKSNIDTKTELAVKQQLVECEYVKTYKSNGSHNRELEVDITICTSAGQKVSISALAIEREFFDELGGIALFERGKGDEAKMRH